MREDIASRRARSVPGSTSAPGNEIYNHPSEPNYNLYLANRLCPTQSSDIKCCLSIPYDEPQCSDIGGSCVDDQRCGSGGTLVPGKCPTQPSGVMCCVKPRPASPGGGSGRGDKCSDFSAYGSSCKSYTRCPSVSVSGICPGNFAQRCCLENRSVSLAQKHLSDEEGGMYLKG